MQQTLAQPLSKNSSIVGFGGEADLGVVGLLENLGSAGARTMRQFSKLF